MTPPRYIVPGETILIIVRTLARFYLLRPDPEFAEAIKYCLGHYAAKQGLTLNAVCVMSTHLHLVPFDASRVDISGRGEGLRESALPLRL